MGCGSSKGIAAVSPVQLLPQPAGDKKPSIITVQSTTCISGSETIPLIKSVSSESRNGSARSQDSGLGGDNDTESNQIIMVSSTTMQQQVSEIPDTLPASELVVSGKQMKTPCSMGQGKRSTLKLPPVHPRNKTTLKDSPIPLEAILQKRVKFASSLINELPVTTNIIKRPVSRGGLAFDIMMDGSDNPKSGQVKREARKVPACVANYSEQRKRTTREELDEKQKVAEQRRKEQEQMRLERIWAEEEKSKHIAEALAKFAVMQTDKADSQKQQGTREVTQEGTSITPVTG